MDAGIALDRRTFWQSGAALIIGFCLPRRGRAQSGQVPAAATLEANAWIAIKRETPRIPQPADDRRRTGRCCGHTKVLPQRSLGGKPGTRRQPPTQDGLAHLIEDLALQGNRRRRIHLH